MTMPDSVSGVAGKPRDVNYDLLRVVAMCLVIGVHVINNYMPVKMTLTANASMGEGQPSMPIQSVILFKNYDFSTPDAALFALPADYVKAAGMQEIMMESMPDMGALMEQMKQLQPAE